MTIKKSSASVLAGILALSVSSFALPAMAAQDQTGAFAVQDGKTAPEENIKDSAKPGDTASDDTADKKDKDKTLADFVEDKEKIEGLFTFYRDKEKGELFMEISEDQLNQEFIYFIYVHNGVTGVPGLAFRGATGNNQVFSLAKHYNRIDFIEENTNFYYDPENPISRSADANVSSAVLATAEIKATSADKKRFLIPVDKMFLSEALTQLTPDKRPGDKDAGKYGPGKLNSSKSKITDINNYPENSDVIVDYVFDDSKAMPDRDNIGGLPRNGKLTLQHSFIQMPKNDFKPRLDDPRVGYFFQRATDMISHSATPYRDVIDRWSLVKKNPEAALSEPVEPIVYWIENTTPVEYRDTIRDALLTWNEAFEKAGFKDAIQVKIQPDDADWDAGDIRYNVLRWTASPRPRFGGYGPHFVNPRTGQVLGADIMLEQVFVTNRVHYSGLFETTALGLGDDSYTAFAPEQEFMTCSMGHQVQMAAQFGRSVLTSKGATEVEKNELVKQGLYYLTLHEVGHTLGLNHNMKATQLHAYKDIHDTDLTSKVGLAGSVMDYPAINIAGKGKPQGQFYTMKPGPYDLWAIEFGYSPDLEDPAKRRALLERSGEPALAFGNDADDMRAPGKAIDPRVMIGDMSGDAIAFAAHEIALSEDTLSTLLEKYDETGQSWHELRDAFFILSGAKGRAGGVISRYIGGVYVDRAFVGQDTVAKAPYVPVSKADQKRAMGLLRAEIFAPDAFAYPAELISHLQPQRRGFDFRSKGEDPKMHGRVLKIQEGILSHLTHKDVLQRITDSGLYGNDYSVAEMMGELTDAIFEADLKGDVNSYRQNLQVSYIKRLVGIVQNKAISHQAHAAAFANLNRVSDWMAKSRRGGSDTRAHRDFLKYTIDQALYPAKS
ncbi:zinc-dependent metalloprotease [Paremcibacter congregatus]|uniref:zinc-dependent metalloprotease n=1 Tax=Paremcibacter congregatus TaxID=2043170 RepID=UPI003A904557